MPKAYILIFFLWILMRCEAVLLNRNRIWNSDNNKITIHEACTLFWLPNAKIISKCPDINHISMNFLIIITIYLMQFSKYITFKSKWIFFNTHWSSQKFQIRQLAMYLEDAFYFMKISKTKMLSLLKKVTQKLNWAKFLFQLSKKCLCVWKYWRRLNF